MNQHATTSPRSATSPVERVNGVSFIDRMNAPAIGKTDAERFGWRPLSGVTKPPVKTTDHARHDEDLARSVVWTGWMRRGFYVLVLAVALAGQATGIAEVAHLSLLVAIPPVLVLELGGVVVLANADVRRRLGERAHLSRLLSVAIALGAATFNWLAHADHLLGGFFAGMSVLGYLVYLTHSENQRRDRLRATGDLPPTAPAYELWAHWLRHPLLTLRARSLAKENVRLGLYGSLREARSQVRLEHQAKAIGKVVGDEIRKADPDGARIALKVYEMAQIGARLAASADYDGLTSIVAARVHPAALTRRLAELQERPVSDAPVSALADAGPSALSDALRAHLSALVEDAVDALRSAPADAPVDAVSDAPTSAPERAPEAHFQAHPEAQPTVPDGAPAVEFSSAPQTRSRAQSKRTADTVAGAPLDAVKVRKLTTHARRNGGRMSERAVKALLSVGSAKAKEYMTAAGLPLDDIDPPNGATS